MFLLTTGCSSYTSLDADLGYTKYLETSKVLSIDEKSPNGSIELTLIMPKQCGGYFEKANHRKEINEDVAYQCIGFPLYTGDPGKEIKQKVKDDDAKPLKYYVFDSFGKVAKTCMEKQLGAYFNQVEINLESTGQMAHSQASSVMSYYAKWGMGSDQYILVKLIAKSSDGEIIVADGKATDKLGNAHAIWFFPVSILTFPVGWLISMTILENNRDALVSKTIAHAIDIAAAELSKKLAESMAQNPEQMYKVYVMLE